MPAAQRTVRVLWAVAAGMIAYAGIELGGLMGLDRGSDWVRSIIAAITAVAAFVVAPRLLPELSVKSMWLLVAGGLVALSVTQYLKA